MSKERPILFSGDMVNAILAGKKTMTRRVVKPQPTRVSYPGGTFADGSSGFVNENGRSIICPYGKPGDILWVKETWANCQPILNTPGRNGEIGDGFAAYRADGYDTIQELKDHFRLNYGYEIVVNGDCWRPSIFMPRWASRISLTVTEVRVERLQDITEEDALRNGGWDYRKCPYHKAPEKSFWDSIYGKVDYSWQSNPWVWVVGFEKMEVSK